jgi:hypothetical protein
VKSAPADDGDDSKASSTTKTPKKFTPKKSEASEGSADSGASSGGSSDSQE